MEPAADFNVQGHRGARGLKPENTLPSFEVAFDCGVTSVETDVHLSCDGVPVLIHDHCLTEKIYRATSAGEAPAAGKPLVSQLSLSELRGYVADLNPDMSRFPAQQAVATPLASWFGENRGIHPFAIPTLGDLFAFADAFAREPGRRAGKTDEQRNRASRILFDLELKRIPFHPETIGDDATPGAPGLLERRVLEEVRNAGALRRTIVRSFDHRSVRALKVLEPALKTAVIVAGTAPVEPAELAQRALAQFYCPDYRFLDQHQVHQLQQAGIQVLPWTVNDPADWERLYDWGVNGITSDYPDRLIEWLKQKRR